MQLITGDVKNRDSRPIILVHGGAWDIPDEECLAHEIGMNEALEAGERALSKGEVSLNVVVQVLTKMESSGIFDAGRGAVLNQDGEVELDAGIMCGSSKLWGAVSGVKHFENPIRIAHKIAIEGNRQFCFLTNAMAENFAAGPKLFEK